jgi:ubiquinone/menaquinone biosynthesis C-methylase UbiE
VRETPTGDREAAEAIAVHSAQADLFADRYDRLESHPYASCFSYSRKRLHQEIDRRLPSGGPRRLLDVGCGTGHQLASLRARGFEVAGVDGSEAMLAHARRLNPGLDLRLGDAESLPFDGTSFDVVICLEVLRYLPRAEPCVAEMARVLRPGGVCLATASPLLNLSGYPVLNRVACAIPVGRLVRLKQHFHTSWGLRRLFRGAGFRRVEVHGVYFGLVNWVERLTPSLLPGFLRTWEGVDAVAADRPLLRDLSGMLLVHAER